MGREIQRIVLTGGPGSGKSSLLPLLASRLKQLGIRTFPVPEVATLLISAGGRGPNPSTTEMVLFQKQVLRVQLAVEKAVEEIAAGKSAGRTALLFDRGMPDAAGFLDSASWKSLLRDEGYDPQEIVNRYDFAVYLRSVATNLASFYSKDNNPSRLENATQAAAVDDRLLEIWRTHPNLVVINSEADFEAKLRQATDAVCQFVLPKIETA